MKYSRVITVTLITLTISLTLFSINLYPPVNAQQATDDSWSDLPPMPTARGGFGLAVVAGKIYAIGGLNGEDLPLSTVEEYSPQKREWITRASMPTPRSGFALAVFDNKIFCIGGTVGGAGYIGNNEVYDPATNTWHTKTSMPTPRADLAAEMVNGKIYLMGGKHYSSITPFYNETNINEVYDPATDTWATKSPLLTGVLGPASAVMGTKIYLLGGSRQPSSIENTVIVNTNQVYDTETDTWSQAAALPKTSSYGAATVTTGLLAPLRIYLVGGFSDGDFSGKTDVYDPQTNTWSSGQAMPTHRAYLCLVMVNDVLYAAGGFDGTNWLGTFEEYKPVGYGKVPPIIEILSPENKTYTEVLLHFTVNRPTSWIGYSVDNTANVTINSQVMIANLSQGSHSVTIYANDSQGNMGVSQAVYFSVDIMPPRIDILLPLNVTYSNSDVQLMFTVDENVTSLSYSLDRQDPRPIAGNVTLAALSSGQHRLIVYATDQVGNVAEKSVTFYVSPFPLITVTGIAAIIIIIAASGYIAFIKAREKRALKPTLDLEQSGEKP